MMMLLLLNSLIREFLVPLSRFSPEGTGLRMATDERNEV